MTNDGSGVNEWACGSCGTHIGDAEPFLRVTYALDRGGAAYMLGEPELLLTDEYCTPECAIKGSVLWLGRLKKNARVERTFADRRSADAVDLPALPSLDPAELIEGIPGPIVRTYSVLMDQASRLVQQIEGARRDGDTLWQRVYEAALRAVQHRLEGIALAWYSLNGELEDSDERLRVAALSIVPA